MISLIRTTRSARISAASCAAPTAIWSGSSRCATPTPSRPRSTEVTTGIYAFDAATLWPALERLDSDNAQGELYLTDVIEILRATAAG